MNRQQLRRLWREQAGKNGLSFQQWKADYLAKQVEVTAE